MWNNEISPCDFCVAVAASDKTLYKHIMETNRKHLRCLSTLKFYYFWDLKRLRKHHQTLFHTYSWKGNVIKPGQTTLNIKFNVKHAKERNTGGVGRIIKKKELYLWLWGGWWRFSGVVWCVFNWHKKLFYIHGKMQLIFYFFFLTKFGAAERLVIPIFKNGLIMLPSVGIWQI